MIATRPHITLTAEQRQALEKIQAWLLHGHTPYFTLGGLAGSGKTTILKYLVEELTDERILVASPTGKAADVLRRKGLPQAKTVHSTIYDVFLVKGRPHFSRKAELGGTLFIIDEASMVSREMLNDLLSFNIPILFVGDHGQLEPVGDNPGLMLNPNVKLETIHRQAAGSPILTFAHEMRIGGTPSRLEAGWELRVLPRHEVSDLPDNVQIITTFNRSRVSINNLVRKARNLEGVLVPGDRVICLRNNKDLGIFNGQLFTVRSCKEDGATIWASVRDDQGQDYPDLPMLRRQFGQEKTLELERWERDVALFDYAYAITCHKAQGSEWDNVIVFDEAGYVPWTRSRWRYTASTRAAKTLTYLY